MVRGKKGKTHDMRRPIVSASVWMTVRTQLVINGLSARGWELRKKGKKQQLFLVLSPRPGPMAQMSQAGTGDSVSRFRHSRCSTLFNYTSYFPMGRQFCFQLLFTT